MNSGKVLLGVLAGVAAGAMIGILFAPDKGARTRKKILSKGEDYADGLQEKFDELLENMTEKFENTLKETEELMSKLKMRQDGPQKEAKHSASHN